MVTMVTMATKKSKSLNKSSGNSIVSSSLAIWLGIAAIVLLIDQITKITVEKLFVYGENLYVTSFFNLTLAYNKGAAFSFLASESGWQRYFFTAIGLIAASVIIYLLKKNPNERLFCWSLSLIMGGAIGNVIDRIMYGHVIDFLDFHYKAVYHFPAFNIADSAICLGAALFILDELRRVKK